MKPKLLLCLAWLAAIAPIAVCAGQQSSNPGAIWTFGVVPQQAASKMAQLWVPILNYIGERTGHTYRFATAKNIPTFEHRLANGDYHLAYMNPYHYTVFHESPGYVAIAKASERMIKGIIVVRKDSPLKSVSDLAGKTVAFPSPAAFAATVLPKANFVQMGIPIDPVYVSSHDSVYRSIAKGLHPAGGGIYRTLNSITPSVREKLRVLWSTAAYTPHAVAAHPDVPPAVAQSFVRVLARMSEDPQGRQLLSGLRIKGFQAAHDRQWDDVRALGTAILRRDAAP